MVCQMYTFLLSVTFFPRGIVVSGQVGEGSIAYLVNRSFEAFLLDRVTLLYDYFL